MPDAPTGTCPCASASTRACRTSPRRRSTPARVVVRPARQPVVGPTALSRVSVSIVWVRAVRVEVPASSRTDREATGDRSVSVRTVVAAVKVPAEIVSADRERPRETSV